MARPIEPTPILTGKDAKRFLHRMEEGRKIPIEEMEQMMRDYEELRKITDGDKMDYKDFDIHLLSSNDNVDSFNCGNEDLNEFIQNDAVDYFDQKLAYNYVMQKADQTIAYFSLANDRIAIDDFESKTHFNRFRRRHFVNSKRIKTYPAAKLCRFAVDSKYRGKRIGSSLLNMIKFTLSKESQTACRFLIVDAYREAFAFYIKNGFTPLRECDQIEGPTIPMYFDLFDIS